MNMEEISVLEEEKKAYKVTNPAKLVMKYWFS